MTTLTRPFGTWSSIISPTSIAGDTRLYDVQWDTASETLVWNEGRATGSVIVAQKGMDAPRDLTNHVMSPRGGVGYGGGTFTVANGQVYFAANQRLYRQSLDNGFAEAVTPAFGNLASPRVSINGKWVVFVHTYEGRDCLALVDSNGEQWARKLLADSDFVMQPAWHPAGTHIATITWNQPQMPWNGTELRLLHLKSGTSDIPDVDLVETIVGTSEVAIFQPEFSPDGEYLAYISDQSGYGQLYIYSLIQKTHHQVTFAEAEHGKPAWVQGMRTYGWSGDSQFIYYLRNEGAITSLWCINILDGKNEKITELDEYTYLEQLTVNQTSDHVAMIASAPSIPTRIISYSPSNGKRIHHRASTENLRPEDLSTPQPISWVGHDDEPVHGIFFPPHNPQYTGSGKPPLVVSIHSGPTSQKHMTYDLEPQFYATRGFAVLQVNFRGSTGYGKMYMNKHAENYGVYEVEDAYTGAQHLIANGVVNPNKVIVEGGSSGGFAVLQSLIKKSRFYAAGICRYGISNQFLLALDTHKFEARYNDWLLGKLPDAADNYREQSPIFHTDAIVDPLILFQGTDDKVVPKEQSDAIASVLHRRSIPHEYHVYEGEGHGWRKPETITDYYEKVLRFLMQYVIYT